MQNVSKDYGHAQRSEILISGATEELFSGQKAAKSL